MTDSNLQAELMSHVLAADDSNFDGPVHFAGKHCGGTIAASVWYDLLGLAAEVAGFDTAPYRLDRSRVALSAEEALRLADAVDATVLARGGSPDNYRTYLQPLRAGAVTLFPASLATDAPLDAMALDFG
jgi:hypothetical protein